MMIDAVAMTVAEASPSAALPKHRGEGKSRTPTDIDGNS